MSDIVSLGLALLKGAVNEGLSHIIRERRFSPSRKPDTYPERKRGRRAYDRNYERRAPTRAWEDQNRDG